jgi:hypothetical protein
MQLPITTGGAPPPALPLSFLAMPYKDLPAFSACAACCPPGRCSRRRAPGSSFVGLLYEGVRFYRLASMVAPLSSRRLFFPFPGSTQVPPLSRRIKARSLLRRLSPGAPAGAALCRSWAITRRLGARSRGRLPDFTAVPQVQTAVPLL